MEFCVCKRLDSDMVGYWSKTWCFEVFWIKNQILRCEIAIKLNIVLKKLGVGLYYIGNYIYAFSVSKYQRFHQKELGNYRILALLMFLA